MRLFGFNDGEEISEEVLSFARLARDKEVFCTFAGRENLKPIYMVVTCEPYGCHAQTIWNGQTYDKGYLHGGRRIDAIHLCEYVRDHSKVDLRSVDRAIDDYYGNYYNGVRYSGSTDGDGKQ